jgi:hypothetical protein
MRLLVTTLALAFSGFLASAADNPLAGSWKLNAAKSLGPAPPCVQDGILKIRAEVFTGSPKPDPARGPTGAAHTPESGKCATVYLFTPSPDGRTLTLTQPQGNPVFKSVFEKQK